MKTCYTLFIYMMLWLLPMEVGARQRVWQDVKAFLNNQTTIEVVGVAVNDTATLVSFVASGKPDTSFLIREGCHLRDEQGRCYVVRNSMGITLGRNVWFERNGRMDFTLSFSPLADDVRVVDFVESEMHRNRVAILGLAEGGLVDVARYAKRSISGMFDCRHSFGTDEAVIRGKLEGYDSKRHPLSLFLCDEFVLADEMVRPVASCHIGEDGSFTLRASVRRASLMVLTSEEGEDVWQIPVFVHPADKVSLVVNLKENRITAYQSKCQTSHLAAMQEVGVLGGELCQPRMSSVSFSLTATYESPATKGKAIIEGLAKQYRGKYVEFVGLSQRTMVSTLNLLSNIRYDFYEHPDIQLVYLFNGRDVPRGYYEQFVARYLGDEDTHLLSAVEFAAVREFLLSREPSVVGTLNREGHPLVFPLNYHDEFEFRRRFRLILHTESDALTHEEQVMIDTMIEVPDTLSLIYDREHTFGTGSELISQPQARAERRQLRVMWWLMGSVFVGTIVLLFLYWRKRKAQQAKIGEQENEERADESQEASKPFSDNFWDNLIAAWATKKPKNGAFLAKLNAACPQLTKREVAMCLIYYSEDMTDEQMMEILEMPSSAAYRTARSRLRKKLKEVEWMELKKLKTKI